MAEDNHSAYLAQALAALTPDGRQRVDELLEQMVQAAAGRERLARFAEVAVGQAPPEPMSPQELEALTAGFMAIRDQEPLDDVGTWANAVLALLADEHGPHS